MSNKTFIVWCPDLGQEKEDGYRIKASDTEFAAEQWADRYDAASAEYAIVNGKEREVTVVEDREGTEELRFSVTGEAVRQYYARPVKEKP
jgi:hypothetical protein